MLPETKYFKVRQGYFEFFNCWNWEWHITHYFRFPVDLPIANRLSKNWLKKILRDFQKINAAGMMRAVNPHNTTPHVHIALTSSRHYPLTLAKLQRIYLNALEQKWKYGKCKITTKAQWKDNATLARYLSIQKNLPLHDQDKGELEFYRPKQLMKMKFQPIIPKRTLSPDLTYDTIYR